MQHYFQYFSHVKCYVLREKESQRGGDRVRGEKGVGERGSDREREREKVREKGSNRIQWLINLVDGETENSALLFQSFLFKDRSIKTHQAKLYILVGIEKREARLSPVSYSLFSPRARRSIFPVHAMRFSRRNFLGELGSYWKLHVSQGRGENLFIRVSRETKGLAWESRGHH